MKTFFNLILVMLFATVMAAGAQMVGLNPAVGFGASIGLSVVHSFVAPFMPSGLAFMGLQRELWTGEIVKKFRHENSFLSRIANKNNMVKNNTIHLVDIGADPAVLINNTTYPIASAQRVDADIPIGLDKFQTENTIITDDELYALPYDKPGSVIADHREALEQKTAEKSAHSLCPQAATANTPLIMTSGNSNGATNARKRLTINDIIAAKKALDDLKVPKEGRELVLCNDHVEDLLLTSQVFKDQYHNIVSGKINNIYGFLISEFVANPLFSNTTGEKKAFGAALAPTTDLAASFFYYNKRAVQARGDVKMYRSKAEDDPKYRQSEIGFTLYHLCLPKKDTGFGAIVSSVV